MNSGSSRTTTIVLGLLYFVLLVCAFCGSWVAVVGWKNPLDPNLNLSAQWKNFGAIATVITGAISSMMAAILSIYNVSAQAAAAEGLEKVKHVLDKRIPAHGSLYAAAVNYYRALAPLETGNFNFNDVETAETKMKNSEEFVVYVAEDYAQAWRAFWQNVRFMKENVHKNIPDANMRKQYWKDEVKKLGAQLENLENLARKQFA